MAEFRKFPWRVGRTLGRTIYVQLNPEPSKNDLFIGIMDDRELAEYVVEVHNRSMDPRWADVVQEAMDEDKVPCGNPDRYCGRKGGTARCGGCNDDG